jgi:hypothetical protein
MSDLESERQSRRLAKLLRDYGFIAPDGSNEQAYFKTWRVRSRTLSKRETLSRFN